MAMIHPQIHRAAWGALLTLAAATTAAAQSRVVLPQGSVIIVRTAEALQSSAARVGQTFETIVDDTVGIDSYTVIPQGSRIRGIVSYVQAANRQQSGVIEVDFDRLILTDGTTYTIDGKLTSVDSAERRQIESSANQRVVLVGGRGGIGAAIAGAGSASSSSDNILSALGSLLSEGRDVSVPAGTPLAVQLERSITLRGLAGRSTSGTIYTTTETIRAAQQALARQGYYRGVINGQLNYATQRALFAYQADRNLTSTGNLDWATARALGLNVSAGGTSGAMLSAADASALRRNMQALVTRARQDLGVSGVGQLSTRRNYSEADLDLWFALSAFADNALLYEGIVRQSGATQGATLAGGALLDAARRVDLAIQSASVSSQLRNGWNTVRNSLTTIDGTYR